MITVSTAFLARLQASVLEPVFDLQVTGYNRPLMQPGWIVSLDRLRQSNQDLAGGSGLAELAVTVLDRGGDVTADLASLTLEGKDAVLKHGFAGMDPADFATLFTGVVDRVESVADNTAYRFVCKDNLRLLHQTVFLTGDDGEATAPDHPKTIKKHPLQILLDILNTEIGLPAAKVDSTKINTFKNDLFPGFEFDFKITRPVDAKQFIERELMMPLGGFVWANNLGKITVSFFWPEPGQATSQFTFDESNLFVLPQPVQSELVNVVIQRMDDDGGFKTENVEKDSASITKFGMEGVHIIESKGMRSSLQGVALARFVAQSVFNVYGDKNARVVGRATWRALRLEPGDFVTLSHPRVPDRTAGTLGITDRLFRVLSPAWDFRTGRMELRLLDATKIKDAVSDFRRIAPAGVPVFASATAAQRAAYMFVADDATGQYSTGDEGFKLA